MRDFTIYHAIIWGRKGKGGEMWEENSYLVGKGDWGENFVEPGSFLLSPQNVFSPA